MTPVNLIGEHMWPVTSNELEGHSSVSELFKCKLSTICAALYKISAGTPASHGSLMTAGFLVQVNWKIVLEHRFTACMPLLMGELVRRVECSSAMLPAHLPYHLNFADPKLGIILVHTHTVI